MSDADQQMIQALQAKVAELQKENEALKKQQGSQGQSSQPAPPTEKQAVRLTASGTKGQIGKLAGGTGLARLLDKDGEPIEGETIIFQVDGREVGSGTTDGNGEVIVTSPQNPGDPQMWIQGLGNGYTAVFNGTKKYKPAKANGQIGVSIV